jgi:two-component system LytT family response regulator
LEASDNHVRLHLGSGQLLLRETLTAIESRLDPAAFARVSRSALVQLDQIRELQPALHGDYTILLRDGTKLALSRSLRAQLERFAPGIS